MSKPTSEELERALETAKLMREQDMDPDFVAKSFLNCHFQSVYLQQVLVAAQHYVNSGLGEREHTRLVQAISKVRDIDELSAKTKHQDLGLN